MGEFAGVPEWPEQLSSGRDARHDNEPPLAERIALEFQESLDKPEAGQSKSISQRIAELLESAGKVPEIKDEAIAGKVGDLIKMARDVEKRVENAREIFNRPLIEARNSLKAKADSTLFPLQKAINEVRGKLNAFMQAEAAKKEAERRAAEEAARRAAIAAAEVAQPGEPQPEIRPAKVEAPVARGDLGARVGTRTVWHSEILKVRQLPDRLLNHPKVIEALQSVVAAEVRSGAREIKGVKIWSTQEANVR